jgi:hypothetical protein
MQKAKDCLVGVLTVVVLEHLDMNAGGIFFAKALDELDLRVNAIIVANETTDKTNDHDGRSGRNTCRRSLGL